MMSQKALHQREQQVQDTGISGDKEGPGTVWPQIEVQSAHCTRPCKGEERPSPAITPVTRQGIQGRGVLAQRKEYSHSLLGKPHACLERASFSNLHKSTV